MILLICGIKQQTQPETKLIDREHTGGYKLYIIVTAQIMKEILVKKC